MSSKRLVDRRRCSRAFRLASAAGAPGPEGRRPAAAPSLDELMKMIDAALPGLITETTPICARRLLYSRCCGPPAEQELSTGRPQSSHLSPPSRRSRPRARATTRVTEARDPAVCPAGPRDAGALGGGGAAARLRSSASIPASATSTSSRSGRLAPHGRVADVAEARWAMKRRPTRSSEPRSS